MQLTSAKVGLFYRSEKSNEEFYNEVVNLQNRQSRHAHSSLSNSRVMLSTSLAGCTESCDVNKAFKADLTLSHSLL